MLIDDDLSKDGKNKPTISSFIPSKQKFGKVLTKNIAYQKNDIKDI